MTNSGTNDDAVGLRQQLANARQKHENFGRRLRDVIEHLLDEAGVSYVAVSYRVKSEEGALKKAERPDVSITGAADLHDFLGVRVVTYFEDQVDRVATLLGDAFALDTDRTKDRRRTIDPDRFGYLSLHMSLRLDEQRAGLPEWSSFADLKVEVQIRSALQHAWAEIEHDLGYKTSTGSIPDVLRRRFSRLAGLLEIADDEFMALRAAIDDYEQSVGGRIKRGESVAIDQASIHAFVESDRRLATLDTRVAARIHEQLLDDISMYYVRHRAQELRSVGLTTVEALARVLEREGDSIAEVAAAWMARTPPDPFDVGISRGLTLFYVYLCTLARDDPDNLPYSVHGLEDDDGRFEFIDLVRQHLGTPDEGSSRSSEDVRPATAQPSTRL